MKWLNDPRVRSTIAGAIGGLVGWWLAEKLCGQPESFGGALVVGLLAGVGIGGTLGAAEGVAIRSWNLAKRGALIGLGVGLVGGSVGAMLGQIGYAATSTADRSGDSGAGRSTVFSSSIRKRLKEAGARKGEIEIALSWENRNDLDLWVVDPTGHRIFWNDRQSPSGGELDVDRNAACAKDVTDEPVEHVVWDRGTAPSGRFQVLVDHYENCGPGDPTPFHIEVKVGDELVESLDRSISHGASAIEVATFAYPIVSSEPKTPVVETTEIGFGSLFARVLGWAVFGALLGSAEGFRRRSNQALRNAAIGGVIGGALGGLIFQIIVWIRLFLMRSEFVAITENDVLARFLGFVILGACIGLWIVIIEQALSAVLQVRSGRYEGRQIFLDRSEMRIGRDDALEIYLGADKDIANHHATVRVEGGSHVLLQEQASMQVNGTSVTRQVLQDGDTITLGTTRLVYSGKGSSEPRTTTMQAPVKQAPPPPGLSSRNDKRVTSKKGPQTVSEVDSSTTGDKNEGGIDRRILPPPPPRGKT